MPEFEPAFTPKGLDDFTEGYADAAEWLIDEDQPKVLHGWTRNAILRIKKDCTKFQKENEADLAKYCEISERNMASAGHDFWLTRNHHGAGFWDRGDDPVFRALTDAAHAYGEINTWVTNNGYINFM